MDETRYAVNDSELENGFYEDMEALGNPTFEAGSDINTLEIIDTGDPRIKTIKASGEADLDSRTLGKNEPLNRQATSSVPAPSNETENDASDKSTSESSNETVQNTSAEDKPSDVNTNEQTTPDKEHGTEKTTPFTDETGTIPNEENNHTEDAETQQSEALAETSSDTNTNGNSEDSDDSLEEIPPELTPKENDIPQKDEENNSLTPSVLNQHPTDNTIPGLRSCKRNILSAVFIAVIEKALDIKANEEETDEGKTEQKNTINEEVVQEEKTTISTDVETKPAETESTQESAVSPSLGDSQTPEKEASVQNPPAKPDAQANTHPEPLICPYCGDELILFHFNDGYSIYRHEDPSVCSKTFQSIQMINEIADRIHKEEEDQRKLKMIIAEREAESAKNDFSAEENESQGENGVQMAPPTANTSVSSNMTKYPTAPSPSVLPTKETISPASVSNTTLPTSENGAVPKETDDSNSNGTTSPGEAFAGNGITPPISHNPSLARNEPVSTTVPLPPKNFTSIPQAGHTMANTASSLQGQSLQNNGIPPMNRTNMAPMMQPISQPINPSIPTMPPMSPTTPNSFIIQSGMAPAEMLSIYNFLRQETEKQHSSLENMHNEVNALKNEIKDLNGEIKLDPKAMEAMLQQILPVMLQNILQNIPEFQKMGKAGEAVLQMNQEKEALSGMIAQLTESTNHLEEDIIALSKTTDKVNAVSIFANQSLSQYVNTVRPLEKTSIKMNEVLPHMNEYLSQVDRQYKNIMDKHQDSLNELTNHFIEQSNKLMSEARNKGFLSRPEPRTMMDKIQDFIIPTIIAFFMMLLTMLINK